MIWMLMVVIILQFGYLIFRETVWSKQTKELLNRLMARDLHEYQSITNPVTIPEEKPKELNHDEWKQMMSDTFDGKVG